MDLQCLNIFIQVAELGSFTKAGEKLGYSQPTVSFQIKQLEKELGVQLFDRIGHTIKITEAGRDALVYAQNICHLSQQMLLGEKRDKGIYGNVRVAMADSLCIPLVENKFAEFRKKYPYINVNVKNAGTDELFALIDHNEADIVCTLDTHIYDTNYVIIDEEKIDVDVVVSVDNPLAQREEVEIEDLLHQDFILTEKGMSYRRVFDEYLAKNSAEIIPVLEISNTDIICKLVCENTGVSFLPDYVTKTAVEQGLIKKIKIKGFEAAVWKQLLHHRDKWISDPMKAVMEHLSEISIK